MSGVIEIRVAAEDLARVRFAPDAVRETAASLNAIAFPHGHLIHERLRRRLPRHPGFDLQHLLTLTGNHGWIPDVLAPRPSLDAGRPEEQLAAIEGADPETARNDLRRLRQLRPGSAVARMNEDEYLARTAEAMTGYWREVLRPLWNRVERIVAADITHHGAVLTGQGLAATLPGLHANLSFSGGVVRVAMASQKVVRAAGRGLWFVPSVFRWPWFTVQLGEEPVISYAARGAGQVWIDERRGDDGLVELIGRSRAEILHRVGIAGTTTALALDLQLAPSTVSRHLSVLATSGLVTAHRKGRQVLYRRTLVGDLLIRGEAGPAVMSG